MGNYEPWYSGARIPSIPLIGILMTVPVEEENHRGQQSREEHNQVREFNSRRRFEPPAKRQERKQIFGYYEDKKTGRTYTNAQIDRFVVQSRKGEMSTDQIDKDTLIYHPPEAVTDVIDSIGEKDIPKGLSYPALEIGEGEVIRDPKILYNNSGLK